MRRSLFFLIVLSLLAPRCAAQGVAPETPPVQPEPLDECEVIARVNGQVVLACEVLWQVDLMLEKKRGQFPPSQEPEIRRALMQQHLMSMIDFKMLYGDFRRKAPPEVDIAAIHGQLEPSFQEREVPKLMKRVGVDDPSDLDQRLSDLGTSLRAQREEYFQSMIARSWVNEGLNIDTEVTHDQMLAHYRDNSADFEFATQCRWEELMVRFDRFPNPKAAYDALVKIGNDAYRSAVAQPDRSQPAFEAIAKSRSQGFTAAEGGQHDWTVKGALTAQLVDEAIFTLPVGEMSPILRSGRGWHIVRVLERKEAGRTPFTEVQEEIRKKIRNERSELAFQGRLDEIRRESRIWTIFTGDIDPEEYATARRSGAAKRR